MALLQSTTVEGLHAFEAILSYDNISKDTVTLDEGQVLTAGTVLGQITVGDTADATAFSSNTGDGTMGEITVGAGAIAGTYKLVVIAEDTDAGTFTVTDPNGIFVATGAVDAEFDAGGLTFTLADGAEDFNLGDGFDIVVAAGSGNYVLHDAAATDGSQVARAVLAYDSDATDGDLQVVAITRLAEVKESLLTWKSGISGPNKAAGIAALASHYIIAR
jgi:hypothetical protein